MARAMIPTIASSPQIGSCARSHKRRTNPYTPARVAATTTIAAPTWTEVRTPEADDGCSGRVRHSAVVPVAVRAEVAVSLLPPLGRLIGSRRGWRPNEHVETTVESQDFDVVPATVLPC